jgi:hypothetical protein
MHRSVAVLAATATLAAAPPAGSVQDLAGRPPATIPANAYDYARWLHAWALAAEGEDTGSPCDAARTRAVLYRTYPPEALMDQQRSKVAAGASVVMERVEVSGCGRRSLQNLLVFDVRQPPAAMIPGESLANPKQMAEVTFRIGQFEGSNILKSGCTGEALQQTSRVGPIVLLALPAASDGSWKERWPSRHCGRPSATEVTFTPAKNGSGVYFALKALDH